MAWDDDFGYFGDGPDGYAHYMTAFDRNFGDSDFDDAEYGEYGDPIDTDTIYADAGSCENGGTYEQPVIFAPVQIGPQRKDYPNERCYDAAVYLDQLDRLTDEELPYDADVLITYSSDARWNDVIAVAQNAMADGETVRVQPEGETALRSRRVIRI